MKHFPLKDGAYLKIFNMKIILMIIVLVVEMEIGEIIAPLPTKMYGHGKHYLVNLNNYNPPQRESLHDEGAMAVYNRGLTQLQIMEPFSSKDHSAQTSIYTNSVDKVYHVTSEILTQSKKRYACNIYGKFSEEKKMAYKVETNCKPFPHQ